MFIIIHPQSLSNSKFRYKSITPQTNVCTQVHTGAAPALRISRKKGSLLRPPYVRDFVKEGYFFVPRYEVWRSKPPYNPRNIRGSDAV